MYPKHIWSGSDFKILNVSEKTNQEQKHKNRFQAQANHIGAFYLDMVSTGEKTPKL